MTDDTPVSKVNRTQVAKEAAKIAVRWTVDKLILVGCVAFFVGIAIGGAIALIWISETYAPVETILVPWSMAAIEAVPGVVWTVLLWILNLIGLWILLSILYEVGTGLWEKAEERARGESNGE